MDKVDVSKVVGTAEFWRTLQDEIGPWQARNFPSSVDKPYRPLLGFVEEFGEFYEADEVDSAEGVADALGDSLIFAADFCNKSGRDLSEIVALAQERAASSTEAEVGAIVCGRICHHYLKGEQGIRTSVDHNAELKSAMADAIAIMWDRYDEVRSDKTASIDEVVRQVWEKVSKRDWTKDPVKGGER